MSGPKCATCAKRILVGPRCYDCTRTLTNPNLPARTIAPSTAEHQSNQWLRQHERKAKDAN